MHVLQEAFNQTVGQGPLLRVEAVAGSGDNLQTGVPVGFLCLFRVACRHNGVPVAVDDEHGTFVGIDDVERIYVVYFEKEPPAQRNVPYVGGVGDGLDGQIPSVPVVRNAKGRIDEYQRADLFFQVGCSQCRDKASLTLAYQYDVVLVRVLLFPEISDDGFQAFLFVEYRHVHGVAVRVAMDGTAGEVERVYFVAEPVECLEVISSEMVTAVESVADDGHFMFGCTGGRGGAAYDAVDGLVAVRDSQFLLCGGYRD